MMADFDPFFPFVVTPLLGAFIGYLTNAIAIRMMFRPLHPWRVLGLRLPLTPGIIPGKRRELAARLGRVVGDHLLTSQDALQVLEREGIQDEIRRTLRKKINDVLDREFGPLASLVPEEYQGRFHDLVRSSTLFMAQSCADYLASEGFEKTMERHLARIMDRFLAKNLEDVLSGEKRRKLRTATASRLTSLLTSRRLQAAAARLIDLGIDGLIRSATPLRDFLPRDIRDLASRQLEQEILPLMEKLSVLLYDPAFRRRLEKISRDAIKGLVVSQKGLARILALFINLERVYERIPEFIDKTGEEIARLLREEEPRQAMAAILRSRLDLFLARPLAHYLEKMPLERIAGVRKFLRNRILEMLNSEGTVVQIMALADKGFEHIQDRSFSSLFQKTFGEESSAQLRGVVTEELLIHLRSQETRRLLEDILKAHLEETVYRRPLGRLAARVPVDLREKVEEGIFAQMMEVLKKETPSLFATLNISRMVEEKINSLDILAMENLLLGIMRDQFKYINLFGALLGFLIGLANGLVLGLN